MNDVHNGGPAYPQTHLKPNENGVFHPEAVMGMTLRDYFAGQVLAQYLATAPEYANRIDVAEQAYLTADAMIEARGK